MPPAAVKTVKDLIFWQYAKLISKSAGFGINQRAFQMDRLVKLRTGQISWSSTIREYIKEHESEGKCGYCGSCTKLTLEHVLPLSRGGPDIPDNAILVCQKCNSAKGSKRLYEWKGLKEKDEIPRIAEGKYLKLLYQLHEKNGTLDSRIEDLCPNCDMRENCKKEGKEGKLTVYCLEGLFKKQS
jgi:hypothetical protein